MKLKELLIKIKSILTQIVHLHTTLLIKRLAEKRDSPSHIRIMIGLIAEQEGVDPILAQKVAFCESSYRPIATNFTDHIGWGRGLYQWNSYYHPNISTKQALDPEKSTRLFCQAVKAGHLDWWNASRACWSK